ncbi:MAG: CvpA family protein [Clostridia bacterium]|nr:CvpA family protein [Clostridia bacterium]MDE6472595.1 CvpA family protein [Clostridia bacterium]
MSVISIISIIVLAICFIVGVVRGIVKTLLRLLAVVGTALLTLFITPYLAKALTSISLFKNVHAGVLSGISALIIVIIASAIFGFVIFAVNKRIADSPLSSVNRVLGGFFYAFVGFVALILMGYVINIFRDADFMQAVVADSQKDVFANWLVTNNLFNKFMEAVAKEGGVFWQFINGFKIPVGGGESAPSGDATASGEAVASMINAIARI